LLTQRAIFLSTSDIQMNRVDSQYLNTGYWLLIFIPLAAVAFYPTYFGVWSLSADNVIHTHTFFMILWLAMLIVQPIMIKKKQFRVHRTIGKISFVLVPLILVSAFFMIRLGYRMNVSLLDSQVASGEIHLTNDQVRHNARIYVLIGFLYFSWLMIFYSLAIINRKRPMAHAQYMIAAALTALGPTVDRILFFQVTRGPKIFSIPIEVIAFAIEILILLLLLRYDIRKGYSTRTVSICIAIYLAGQILYFVIPQTKAYHYVAGLLLQ
jgi:hypothetical protein